MRFRKRGTTTHKILRNLRIRCFGNPATIFTDFDKIDNVFKRKNAMVTKNQFLAVMYKTLTVSRGEKLKKVHVVFVSLIFEAKFVSYVNVRRC